MTDERALKLAEQIATDLTDKYAAEIKSYVWDKCRCAALEAIKLTTKLAAEYLRKARTEVWFEGGRFDSDDKAHPVLLRGDGIGMAAEMLEDLEHLPADGAENV